MIMGVETPTSSEALAQVRHHQAQRVVTAS